VERRERRAVFVVDDERGRRRRRRRSLLFLFLLHRLRDDLRAHRDGLDEREDDRGDRLVGLRGHPRARRSSSRRRSRAGGGGVLEVRGREHLELAKRTTRSGVLARGSRSSSWRSRRSFAVEGGAELRNETLPPALLLLLLCQRGSAPSAPASTSAAPASSAVPEVHQPHVEHRGVDDGVPVSSDALEGERRRRRRVVTVVVAVALFSIDPEQRRRDPRHHRSNTSVGALERGDVVPSLRGRAKKVDERVGGVFWGCAGESERSLGELDRRRQKRRRREEKSRRRRRSGTRKRW